MPRLALVICGNYEVDIRIGECWTLSSAYKVGSYKKVTSSVGPIEEGEESVIDMRL